MLRGTLELNAVYVMSKRFRSTSCRVLQESKREKRDKERLQSERHSFPFRYTFAFHSIAVGGWIASLATSIHGRILFVCVSSW